MRIADCVGSAKSLASRFDCTSLQLRLQSRAKLQNLHHLAKAFSCNVGTVRNFSRLAPSCKIFCLQSWQAWPKIRKILTKWLATLQDFAKWLHRAKFARNCPGFCLPTPSASLSGHICETFIVYFLSFLIILRIFWTFVSQVFSKFLV